MDDAISTTVVSESAGLCGFDRCRAPLPGPGPRGGRPFEYCPDRTWPGGKTCKQLAGAQDALRDAFGQPLDTPALTGAATLVSSTAERLTDPLRELFDALQTMKTAAAEEMTAAAARVEEAEATATRERGLREVAESKAAQAQEVAEQARADMTAAQQHAAEHQALAVEAKAHAERADAARKRAELERASAEAVATTERTHAGKAAADARHERERANSVRDELAAAAERNAVLSAERDAARESLDALRAACATSEDRVRAERDAAQAATETARGRLAELESDLRVTLTRHNEQLAGIRSDLASARGDLAAARQVAARHETDLAVERARLRDLRDVLLVVPTGEAEQGSAAVSADDIRARLLAVLLSDPEPLDPEPPRAELPQP